MEALAIHSRVGAGTHANEDVAYFDRGADGSATAHTYEVFHPIFSDEFFGVDGDGWNTHAASHDGHWGILVIAGEGEHVAYGIHFFDIG